MKDETKIINSGRNIQFTHRAINPIVQRTSSIIFNSIAQKKHAAKNYKNGELFYGRYGTLSHFSLQKSMIELENGSGCMLFPCGTAAITHTIFAFITYGDHILITESAYAPTQNFCRFLLNKMNVHTTWFHSSISNNITNLIQHNTKLIILESPGSITMEVQDIPTLIQATRRKKPDIIILLDNTWSSGVFLKALDIGVDISIQSGTKYIIGHSDGMMGTAVSNARCWNTLQEQSYLMGQTIDADTAYIAARGLRTLYVRLKQHEKTGLHLAQWLNNHPKVDRVNHPALPSCQGHKYFIRDFTGSSGLFSFILKKRLTDKQLSNFLDNMKYFKMAYSWGGFESLITTMQIEELNSIRPINKLNFTGTLIRIHAGLEHQEDLIQDLSDGLNRI